MRSIDRGSSAFYLLLVSCALDHSTAVHHYVVESIAYGDPPNHLALGVSDSVTVELEADGSGLVAYFTPLFGERAEFTGPLRVGTTTVVNERGATLDDLAWFTRFDEILISSLTFDVRSVDPLLVETEVGIAGVWLQYDGPEPFLTLPVHGLLRESPDESAPQIARVPEITRPPDASPYESFSDRPFAPWDDVVLTASEPVTSGALERLAVDRSDAVVTVRGTSATLSPRGWWADGAELLIPALSDHFGNRSEPTRDSMLFARARGTRSVDFADATSFAEWTTYTPNSPAGCDRGSACRALFCSRTGSGVFARLESAGAFRSVRIGLRGTGFVSEVEPYAVDVEIALEGEAPFVVESVRLPVDWSVAGWQDATVELPRAVTAAAVRIERRGKHCESSGLEILVDALEAR